MRRRREGQVDRRGVLPKLFCAKGNPQIVTKARIKYTVTRGMALALREEEKVMEIKC